MAEGFFVLAPCPASDPVSDPATMHPATMHPAAVLPSTPPARAHPALGLCLTPALISALLPAVILRTFATIGTVGTSA